MPFFGRTCVDTYGIAGGGPFLIKDNCHRYFFNRTAIQSVELLYTKQSFNEH